MRRPAVNPAQWVCSVCGYIYDPALHHGVRFEDLPQDWHCPGCGFGKSVFRPRQAEQPSADN